MKLINNIKDWFGELSDLMFKEAGVYKYSYKERYQMEKDAKFEKQVRKAMDIDNLPEDKLKILKKVYEELMKNEK